MSLEIQTIEYQHKDFTINHSGVDGYEVDTGNGDFLDSTTLRELAHKLDELNNKNKEEK